jgi:glycosyltransferase involved in cell wall biosynthesis
MLSDRRLLVVSYYAPPYKSVYGTQRLTKFIKYLTRWGWQVDLISTAPVGKSEVDNGAEQLSDSVNVVRLEQGSSKVLARRGVLVPDYFIAWIKPSLEAGRQLVHTRRPSAILATVPPYSNAIAAALLAAETAIPLIVDFRDPWTRIDTGWVIASRPLRWLSALMERAILHASSAILMADEARYARDFFVTSSSEVRSKVWSIFNGYDDEDFTAIIPSTSSNPKFIISYVGGFYDEATFTNLKRAFEKWHSTFPSDLDHVELHHAGHGSAFFEKYGFPHCHIREHGYDSHREAIAIRAASNLQLFSQPPSFKAHVISGKIYEMMRVSVPIIAITNPSGTVARFIERTGTGIVVSNTDPEAAAGVLHECYKAWKEGREIAMRRAQAVAEFSREEQAKQLEAVIERVIRQAAAPSSDVRAGSPAR